MAVANTTQLQDKVGGAQALGGAVGLGRVVSENAVAKNRQPSLPCMHNVCCVPCVYCHRNVDELAARDMVARGDISISDESRQCTDHHGMRITVVCKLCKKGLCVKCMETLSASKHVDEHKFRNVLSKSEKFRDDLVCYIGETELRDQNAITSLTKTELEKLNHVTNKAHQALEEWKEEALRTILQQNRSNRHTQAEMFSKFHSQLGLIKQELFLVKNSPYCSFVPLGLMDSQCAQVRCDAIGRVPSSLSSKVEPLTLTVDINGS